MTKRATELELQELDHATNTSQYGQQQLSKGSTTEDSGGGGSGGLSSGAIAGTAVGVAIVLIIVTGLVWVQLRRRRRYRAQQRASDAHVDDKDMHAARVADSLRSPPSDDGQTPQDQGGSPVPVSVAVSHGRGHEADGHIAYTPHEPADAIGMRRGNLSGAGDHDGRSPPTRSLPRSIAHLVEDGMTDEDIRRLEEEERQLDDEIERAGRR